MAIFKMPDINITINIGSASNDEIHKKLDAMATKQERFDAILTSLDAVTTDLAADFKLFIEEARQGTVSDESLAKAEANVLKLQELAATKENPIPGEEFPVVTE